MRRELTCCVLGLVLLVVAGGCKGLDLGGGSDGGGGGGAKTGLVQLGDGPQTAHAGGVDGSQLDVAFNSGPALGVHLLQANETTAALKFVAEQGFEGVVADAGDTSGRPPVERVEVAGGAEGLALSLSGMDQPSATLTFGGSSLQLVVSDAAAGAPALAVEEGETAAGQSEQIVTVVVGAKSVRFGLRPS